MAGKSTYLPLWSEDNPDEQEFVRDVGKYYNLLTTRFAELRGTVKTSNLWAYLIQLKVIDDSIIEEFTLKKTEESQVEALLFHLLKDTTWRLHAFIRSLCLDNQEHVVSQIFGLNPKDYKMDKSAEETQASHILWSKNNPQEQVLIKSTKYERLVRSNFSKLRLVVRMKNLWSSLMALDVVGQQESEEFKSKKMNQQQVEAFLNYLMKSPCWKFHGFLRALCEDKQQVVLTTILKLDPDDYMDKQSHWMSKLTKAELEKLLKALDSHREVYKRTLMQGRLFDIPSFDQPYDMEPCYIQVVATSDDLQVDKIEVPPEEMLKPDAGKASVKTALLSGPPGAGKSMIVKYYVYKWSKKEDGHNQWDLIVILNISTLQLDANKSPKDNIKEAIKQSLEGSGDVDIVMRALEDTGMKTLLVPDGMDECRDKAIIDMMTELVQGAYKGKIDLTVLGTSRSALCPVSYTTFDRQMKTDGFTREQGINYIARYYETKQRPSDSFTYDYIVSTEGELDHILTNPLCTHIFSIVTADGTLVVRKGVGIKFKDLFEALEISLRRRQLENNKIQTGWNPKGLHEDEDEKIDVELGNEATNFYLLSLSSVLSGTRTFDKKYLEQFDLTEEHPYFIFLKKVRKTGLYKRSYWHFTHQMFCEYFARKALDVLPENIRATILLYISTQPEQQSTQRILCHLLGEDIDQHKFIINTICASLILQSDLVVTQETTPIISEIHEYQNQYSHWKECVEDIINTDVAIVEGKLHGSFNTSEKIRHFFDSGQAQKTGLFSHVLKVSEKEVKETDTEDKEVKKQEDNKDLLSHVYCCICEVQEKYRDKIFDMTIGKMLPISESINQKDTYIYPTGCTRWTKLEETDNKFTLDVPYSVPDAIEAIYHHKRLKYGSDCIINRNLKSIEIILSVSKHLQRLWGTIPEENAMRHVANLLMAISELPLQADMLELSIKIEFLQDVKIFNLYTFLAILLSKDTERNLKSLLVQQHGGLRQIVVNGNDWCDGLESVGLFEIADRLVTQNTFCIAVNVHCWMMEYLLGKQQEVVQRLSRMDKYQKHLRLHWGRKGDHYYPHQDGRWTEIKEMDDNLTVNVCYSLSGTAESVHQHRKLWYELPKRDPLITATLNFNMRIGSAMWNRDTQIPLKHSMHRRCWGAPLASELESTDCWRTLFSSISCVPVKAEQVVIHFDLVPKHCRLNNLLEAIVLESEKLRQVLSVGRNELGNVAITGIDLKSGKCEYCRESGNTTFTTKFIICNLLTWFEKLTKQSSVKIEIRDITCQIVNEDEDIDVWAQLEELAYNEKYWSHLMFTNVIICHLDGSQSRLHSASIHALQTTFCKNAVGTNTLSGKNSDDSTRGVPSHHQGDQDSLKQTIVVGTRKVWTHEDIDANTMDPDEERSKRRRMAKETEDMQTDIKQKNA